MVGPHGARLVKGFHQPMAAASARSLAAGTVIEPGSDLRDAEYGNMLLIVCAQLEHGVRPTR
ncbi:MAG: hypothetical protein LH632_12870 [Rhodoferax sp.]|nr:hypothetical protein [Rhodoferax sp.]